MRKRLADGGANPSSPEDLDAGVAGQGYGASGDTDADETDDNGCQGKKRRPRPSVSSAHALAVSQRQITLGKHSC